MTEQAKYRRAVLTGPKEIEFEELPLGEPEPDEVLVRVRACAICTWEKRAYTGADQRFYPLIGGHEIAGEVAALGADADNGLEIGDRVAVSGLVRCGKCYSCRRGLDNRCDNSWTSNFKPGTPIGPGGLATYKMAKDYQIFKLGDDTDLVAGSLSEPLACVLRSVKKAQIQGGDLVVVMGGGVMGLLHLMVSKPRGAMVVLVEPDAGRRKVAQELGADHVLDPNEENWAETVKELSGGRGAQVVFDAVGSIPVLESGIALLGKAGRLHVYARVYPKGEPLSIDPNLFHDKEIVLTGTMSQSRKDFLQAADMISRGAIDLGPIISATFDIKDIEKAFEASTLLTNYRVVVTA